MSLEPNWAKKKSEMKRKTGFGVVNLHLLEVDLVW